MFGIKSDFIKQCLKFSKFKKNGAIKHSRTSVTTIGFKSVDMLAIQDAPPEKQWRNLHLQKFYRKLVQSNIYCFMTTEYISKTLNYYTISIMIVPSLEKWRNAFVFAHKFALLELFPILCSCDSPEVRYTYICSNALSLNSQKTQKKENMDTDERA